MTHEGDHVNRPKSLHWIRSTPQRSKRTLVRAALGVVVGIGLIAVPDAARAAPTNSNGWITDVDVEPTTLNQGQSVSLDISVTAAVARVGLVDVEINTLEGDRTYQQFWDAQTFAAGVTRHFHVNWPVPANADTGSYIVRVGIFQLGLGRPLSLEPHRGHVPRQVERFDDDTAARDDRPRR